MMIYQLAIELLSPKRQINEIYFFSIIIAFETLRLNKLTKFSLEGQITRKYRYF